MTSIIVSCFGLASRLSSGLVVGLEPLSAASRLALLQDKAARRQLAAEPEPECSGPGTAAPEGSLRSLLGGREAINRATTHNSTRVCAEQRRSLRAKYHLG